MNSGIKPITGTWFSIYWCDKRHFYWNDACMHYTAEQWDALIKDMTSLGLRYLIMTAVISDELCVYNSKYCKQVRMAVDDPLEEVMKACDKYGMNVFLTNDYIKECSFAEVLTPEHTKLRMLIMEELAERYTHHKSFYGWYWAWEAYIAPYFSEDFIKYYNDSTSHARTLTPAAKYLTAPYGTRNATLDKKFLNQLERLDTDIVAYQDTVGCFAMGVDESARSFEILRKAHDLVPQRKLWADVETFDWEGIDNRREIPLISAPFARLERQLAAVSPYVDEISVFIFQGLFTNPDSIAHTGYKEGARYWNEYKAWLKKNNPEMIKG